MLGLSSLNIKRFVEAYGQKKPTVYRLSALKLHAEKALADYLKNQTNTCEPDTLLKYVLAIEKLGDKKKINLYTLDAYEQLIDVFIARIETTHSGKRAWFEALQHMLLAMQDIVQEKISPDAQ